MQTEQQGYFPFFINLKNKKVLIYGAGKIACRRIQILLSFGALVRVVAPEAVEEIKRLAEGQKIIWKKKKYENGEIGKVDFVLSATNEKETDYAIYTECKLKKIPVNTASDKRLCDFYFPAIVKNGNIVAGITSGGENHKEVREIAERIRLLLERQGSTE